MYHGEPLNEEQKTPELRSSGEHLFGVEVVFQRKTHEKLLLCYVLKRTFLWRAEEQKTPELRSSGEPWFGVEVVFQRKTHEKLLLCYVLKRTFVRRRKSHVSKEKETRHHGFSVSLFWGKRACAEGMTEHGKRQRWRGETVENCTPPLPAQRQESPQVICDLHPGQNKKPWRLLAGA